MHFLICSKAISISILIAYGILKNLNQASCINFLHVLLIKLLYIVLHVFASYNIIKIT